MNKLMVISHERSGTHFLINTLASMYDLPEIQLDLYTYEGPNSEANYESTVYQQEVQENLADINDFGLNIIKSHHHHKFFEGFDFESHNITPLYIYRDVRDVMVSCYNYFNANRSLGPTIFPFTSSPFNLALSVVPHHYSFDRAYSYYKNATMVERWHQHVNPFLTDDRFIKVRYEDLNLNFKSTTEEIANKVNKALAKSPTRPEASYDHHGVQPGKGKVGDWSRYLSQAESKQILDHIPDNLRRR